MTWKDIHRVTDGNPEANACLAKWATCLRAVDDIVDNQTYGAAKILSALAFNIQFCSDPFYRRNVHRLQIPALIATGIWEVSVHWEKRPEWWKRQWADVLRHADVLFLGAVCLICRGWESLTEFNTEFLEAAERDHTTRHKPVSNYDVVSCS